MTSGRKPFFKVLKNGLIYFLVRLVIGAVRRLPRAVSLRGVKLIARVAYFFAFGERKKLNRNLRLVYGETLAPGALHGIGVDVFRNIGLNLVDAALLTRLLSKAPDRIMKIEGLEIGRAALAQGKGVILLTAHTGCFELMPARLSLLQFPIMVLGARAYDPRLNRIIVRHRAAFNVTYLERDNDLREILRGLKSGKALGVLCDLDTRVESRFVPFFGVPAKTAVGPFKLGIRFGAPLVPVFTRREKDGTQTMTFYPEIVPQGTTLEDKLGHCMAQFNNLLEKIIRKDPAQWIWMHERWKSKP